VGAGQVIDVHVVPQAGSVRGGVVGAEQLQVGPLADRHVDRDRDQVGLRVVVLANGAVLGGAGGVEVAEGRERQLLDMGQGAQRPLEVELGLPVGVDRRLGQILAHRQAVRDAEGGAGRGKHELGDAGLQHGVQQVQGGGGVVEVVLERVRDRLAHIAVGRKMHDHLDLLPLEDLGDRGLVAQVGLVHRDARGHRPAVAVDQVVQHHRAVPGSR
jgi:hypothetical protein